MDDQRAVEVTVTGRVQGVGFRMSAAQQADRLGVAGWVANEPDGSVALHVEGGREAVDLMLDWLHRGPPTSTVDGVEVTAAGPTGASAFEVR